MEKYCLILGAKSAIARALAAKFAENGFNLYLAGRNAEEINKDAADMRIRHNINSAAIEFDVLDFDGHEEFYSKLDPKPTVTICEVVMCDRRVVNIVPKKWEIPAKNIYDKEKTTEPQEIGEIFFRDPNRFCSQFVAVICRRE